MVQEDSPYNLPTMNLNGNFATTRWSLVLASQTPADSVTRAALSELCETYWYPLYAFLRRRGSAEEEAMELVQGFMARLLEKQDLAVDAQRGRFRTYLIGALRNYATNRVRHDQADVRGGAHVVLPLSFDDAEALYEREPADPLTPEIIYERRWAITVLERALAKLEDESRARGREELFAALRPCLAGAGDAPTYAELSTQLGVTEGALKVALHRLRKRMGELTRAEVAQTLADPSEIDDELRGLFTALGAQA